MNTVARMIRGSVTIPAKVRRELALEDGAIFGFEIFNGMIIMRRVKIVPVDDDTSAPTGPSRQHEEPKEAMQSAEV